MRFFRKCRPAGVSRFHLDQLAAIEARKLGTE
jgi:hypothetical protein